MCHHICQFRCRMPCWGPHRQGWPDRQRGCPLRRCKNKIFNPDQWSIRHTSLSALVLRGRSCLTVTHCVGAHSCQRGRNQSTHIGYYNTDTKIFKDLLPNQVKDRAQTNFSINFLLWLMGTSKDKLFSVEVRTVWLFLTGKISVCRCFPQLF